MKKSIIYLTLITLVYFAFTSCAPKKDPLQKQKTFVLVHGSWQGAFAWDLVKKQLLDEGQKVIVVELPGHGDDFTPPAQVTLELCRDKVIAAINSVTEDVVLVGHSMGGMVVSAVAEKVPMRIQKLIYLGAFLPANGQALIELIGQDPDSKLGPSLIFSADGLTADVQADNLVPIFCADGSEEIKKLLVRKYRAEPTLPTTHKLALSSAAFGKVPKYYIHTLQDLVISPRLQNQMVAASNIIKEYAINSSHCPFLSQPDVVTRMLMDIAY